MKKLLLFIGLMALLSCEKVDVPDCWICETIKTDLESTSLSIPEGFDRVVNVEYCDITEEEIANIEELGTFRHNLFGIPWNQTTICTIK